MIGLITTLLPGLLKIGDKMIEDKDKKAEFAFKVQEIAFKQMEIMLNNKTYPWVDALVKLAYASEQIIKGLFTPILTAVGFGFGLYFELNDVAVSSTVEMVLFGSFPAWRVARQKEKNAKIEKDKKLQELEPFEED